MQPVDSLNDNDVLFGRGNETSFYVGTRRFRDLVDTKKAAYSAAKKRSEKNALAAEIVATIRERGGRFLKQDETSDPVDDIIEDGTWVEVKDEKEILDKTKQTLRQINPIPNYKREREDSPRNPEDGFESMVPPFIPSATFSAMNLVPSPALVVPAFDPRLLLFHSAAAANPSITQALLLQQQQQALLASILRTPLLQQGSFSPAANLVASASPTTVQSEHFTTASLGDQKPAAKTNDSEQKPLSASESTNNEEVSEDVEEFLLSVLQLSGLPTFTDHATERANMTDEERAAALSDMYGKYCNVDIHKSKKTRQDLDAESIAFLVAHMRSEIERVPVKKKQALLEAQLKCADPEEFSDARLERFLRVERMDAQLAAKRFVLYWEKRREVFGPEKFTMRMTLSEALCDDLAALEVGWLQLLPKLDSSGRQLMLLTPAYHNKEGYTSESLLRAAWYVVEVASRSRNDFDGGVVELVNDKGCTVWEYDHWVYTRFTDLLLTCWPCRFDCFHVFNAPEFISRTLIPIICALQTKESRARNNFHDVPEDEIVSVLSEYGITRDRIPAEFGGSVQLNPSEWLAHRRSVEMEEL